MWRLLFFAPWCAAVEVTKETWDEPRWCVEVMLRRGEDRRKERLREVLCSLVRPLQAAGTGNVVAGGARSMKPDWDKLMMEYEEDPTILVADVDCIGAGKAMCDVAGIKGFPTLKRPGPTSWLCVV